MEKKVEKFSDTLVYLLAILLVFAVATEWGIVMKVLVIIDALALLGTVLYKAFKRR